MDETRRRKREPRNETISFRATPTMRRAIDTAARKDRRRRSDWLLLLVEGELVRRGLLEEGAEW